MKKTVLALVLGSIAPFVLCFIVTSLFSCSSEKLDDTDYIVNFVDDSIVVYHNDHSYVGTVKAEGQLDSLITAENE